jgi:hypothetical protein
VLISDGSLFRGYVCDLHKGLLRSRSLSAPWMVDHRRFRIGTPYLVTQWGRAFVIHYALGEAQNWQELEAEAVAAVAAQGGIVVPEHTLRYYACPELLGRRALG